MRIDLHTAVFFDASCLIAASGSFEGGSGFLLSLCIRGWLLGVVSQPVLIEAERNIRAKLGNDALVTFYRLLALVPFKLVPIPSKPEMEKYETLVNPKDAHVVAAAEASKTAFLLTLDKRLALEVNQAHLDIQAYPGDFIKKVLVHHLNYSRIR
jgi:predicted nucleic acid-binding protein